jgi:hypothetical protein
MKNTNADATRHTTDVLTAAEVAAAGVISQFQANQLQDRGLVFVLDQRVADQYRQASIDDAKMVAKIASDADAKRQREADAEWQRGHQAWLIRTEREAAERQSIREVATAGSGVRVV